MSGIYCMISSTRHSSILHNISIVWVLTFSFRFNLVICPGLTPYLFIKAYCETPFSFIVLHKLSYDITTCKPHFPLECYLETMHNHIDQNWSVFCPCLLKGRATHDVPPFPDDRIQLRPIDSSYICISASGHGLHFRQCGPH